MPINTSILTEIDHLRDLKPAEQAALAERIELLKFAVGEPVFSFGDPGHALYIVRSGEVEIYVKNDQGEKIVLEISKPGDIFGEVSLLDDGPRTAWVTAISDVELLRLDRQHFEDYVRLHTPAALNLLSVTARRLRKSDELIRRTVTRNANDVNAEQRTLASVIVDAICNWSGSLQAVAVQTVIFAIYMLINARFFHSVKPWDPYPYNLLSLIVGLDCIFLALFVLASQNRQQARDKVRSDIEFETSVNTELKIAYLHEKIDRLSEANYQVLVNTQKMMAKQAGR